MNTADLLLILHAHLPFIRHPEHEFFLEENWLYEAVTECYLPLLSMLHRLRAEGADYRITINVSPPLCEMLADPLLQRRYRKRFEALLKLAEREAERTRGQDEFHATATFYVQHFHQLHETYNNTFKQDLIGAFRSLFESGHAEPIACAATHAILPLIQNPVMRRAQIRQGIATIERNFGLRPRGIWLPECAYASPLEADLLSAGVEYFFVESHGLLGATPPPASGTSLPMKTPSGLTAFARDSSCSRQVWSAQQGYPGDPAYREYYRDLGFDAPLSDLGELAHPDGIRYGVGIKYHRVTGPVPLQDKQPYDPQAATRKAQEHARHFLATRIHDTNATGHRPVFVAPYDAELFGHWWFEGPVFLEELLRACAESDHVRATSGSVVLDETGDDLPVGTPSSSTWGYNGHLETWVSGANDWIYRHLHKAERSVLRLAQTARAPWTQRICRQAGRELLLAQSSDWAFILSTGTAADYARSRLTAHLNAVAELCRLATRPEQPSPLLDELEQRDNLFPDLTHELFLA